MSIVGGDETKIEFKESPGVVHKSALITESILKGCKGYKEIHTPYIPRRASNLGDGLSPTI
jgi:hypothetical protein